MAKAEKRKPAAKARDTKSGGGKKTKQRAAAEKKLKPKSQAAADKKLKPKLKPKLKLLAGAKKVRKKVLAKVVAQGIAEPVSPPPPPLAIGPSSAVLDRLWSVVMERRDADPNVSHSARLLSRGTGKVAQKFGEEAVECLIEATAGNRTGLIGESADVLYHLIVMWVNAGVRPDEVWAELKRREGVSGIAEKASRAQALPLRSGVGTTKIP